MKSTLNVIFGFHTGTPAARYKVVNLHCLGIVIFNNSEPVPVAARCKVWVCRRSPAEIVGSNFTGGMDICCERRVLSGRGLCVELITRPEESYRLWCVVVCDLETW